jgi:hypothetical protein
MRGFVVLLSYVVGLSAVIGIGMIGLMALNKPTPIRSARRGHIAKRASRESDQATDGRPKRCAT